ncbi:MAG TPA: hypothetical protein VFP84_21735 [Kofleriaceae bacterium]|nr:hypothetical protein [Kofleriaceae bacterium]
MKKTSSRPKLALRAERVLHLAPSALAAIHGGRLRNTADCTEPPPSANNDCRPTN